MTSRNIRRLTCLSLALLVSLAAPAPSEASSIGKPADARTWILVSSGDCDDDGPNANVDRGHCVGVVNNLAQAGDLGHGQFGGNFSLFGAASLDAESFHGSIQTTEAQFGYLHMSMVDTYTLHSQDLPVGTIVPVTVTFQSEGTMQPVFVCCGAYGSGVFEIRIGSTYIMDPIVVPEGSRVGGPLGPNSSAALPFLYPRASAAAVPLDLTATATLDATIGTPFDLAYALYAAAIKSTIDFSNTAHISFTLPDGVTITSTGGYGQVVPVEPTTWSSVKNRFFR